MFFMLELVITYRPLGPSCGLIMTVGFMWKVPNFWAFHVCLGSVHCTLGHNWLLVTGFGCWPSNTMSSCPWLVDLESLFEKICVSSQRDIRLGAMISTTFHVDQDRRCCSCCCSCSCSPSCCCCGGGGGCSCSCSCYFCCCSYNYSI